MIEKLNIVVEMDKRIKDVTEKITTRLNELGYATKDGLIWVDDTYTHINFKYERVKGTGWNARYTGKVRIAIGSPAKSYPETKNGFDIDQTVERILKYVKEDKLRKQNKELRMALYDQAVKFFNRMVEEMETTPGYVAKYYESAVKSNNIEVRPFSSDKVEVTVSVTEEQFKDIMALMEIK